MSVYYETFLNKWFRPPLPDRKVDLTGRVVIVTGSNGGLGKEAARKFYRMMPKTLILAVRDVAKGEAAKKDIIGRMDNDEGHNSKTQVLVWPLDLSSFDSVKTFAAKANKELDRLDILLENAAIGHSPYTITNDGWENSVQINVISTFLLASLLFPLLSKTAKLPSPAEEVHLKPHLTFVTSDSHFMAKFWHRSRPNIFEALGDKSQYDPTEQYCTTKLLQILLVRQLAKSPVMTELQPDGLGGSEIVTCSINPGFSRSDLMRHMPVPSFVLSIMNAILARTTEEGSKNQVWASLDNDIPNGAYTSDCTVAKPLGYAADPESFEMQERVWKEFGGIITSLAPETKEFWRI